MDKRNIIRSLESPKFRVHNSNFFGGALSVTFIVINEWAT